MGWTRPSHRFQSPTTRTALAPGAHTANVDQQNYLSAVAADVILPMFKEAGTPFLLVYWSRDPDGSQRMSVARARAVLDYIKEKAPGFDASKITVKGYGATADTSYQGRLRSRRVELKSLMPDSLKLEAPKRMPMVAPPPPAPKKR